MSALIILGGMGSLLVVISLWKSVRVTIYWVLMLTLVCWLWLDSGAYLNNLFSFSSWSVGVGALSILCHILVHSWVSSESGEFSVLWLFVLLSTLLLMCANHWILVYLSLEMQSLSLFIIMCYPGSNIYSVESALKYFVMGALSSGVFLLGCFGLFLETGTLYLHSSLECLGADVGSCFFWFYVMILSSILFKLASAPFHQWLPDVYQGSSPIVVLFMSSVPKVGVWFLLVKLCYNQPLILTASTISLLVGSVGAMNQALILSLAAYSSIAHMGFILWPLASHSLNGLIVSSSYLIIYLVSFIVWVGTISAVSLSKWSLHELISLRLVNPTASLTQLLAVVSLAGVPPMGGFVIKWWVIQYGIEEGYLFLPLFAVFVSIVGGIYYLNIAKLAFFGEKSDIVPWSFALKEKGTNLSLKLVTIGGGTFILLSFVLNPSPLLTAVYWYAYSL